MRPPRCGRRLSGAAGSGQINVRPDLSRSTPSGYLNRNAVSQSSHMDRPPEATMPQTSFHAAPEHGIHRLNLRRPSPAPSPPAPASYAAASTWHRESPPVPPPAGILFYFEAAERATMQTGLQDCLGIQRRG